MNKKHSFLGQAGSVFYMSSKISMENEIDINSVQVAVSYKYVSHLQGFTVFNLTWGLSISFYGVHKSCPLSNHS